MTTITIKAELLQEQRCIDDYRIYVFKNLEDAPFGHNYAMVTMFPNWQHSEINVGDQGYLVYQEIVAGDDSWYNKELNQKIPYNYSNLVFIRFIPFKKPLNEDIVL